MPNSMLAFFPTVCLLNSIEATIVTFASRPMVYSQSSTCRTAFLCGVICCWLWYGTDLQKTDLFMNIIMKEADFCTQNLYTKT